MEYEKLEKLLKEAEPYFRSEPEKTIFSIGGRGYYENPITDVLAFFLDPSEIHGFGKLFLDCLFRSLPTAEPQHSLDLVDSPKREISTTNGKRLDLLLEGEDWVLVIENKIYHDQVNPFIEYENFVEECYNGKKPIYVVLSPVGDSVSENWIPLAYTTLIEEIKSSIGKFVFGAPYNKWFAFLRDFILNVELYAVNSVMDEQAMKLIENNYKDVVALEEMRKEYVEHLRREGLTRLKAILGDQQFSTAIHKWRNGPAIRFYSESWIGKSNLVLQLDDRGIGVFIYAYEVKKADVSNADKMLQKNHFRDPKTEIESIRCYESGNRFKEHRDALNEFEEIAKDFDDYNRSRVT